MYVQYSQLLCCTLLVVKLFGRFTGGLGGLSASNVMEGTAAHPALCWNNRKRELVTPEMSFGNSMCNRVKSANDLVWLCSLRAADFIKKRAKLKSN